MAEPDEKTWWVYILRCADDSFYVGCTNGLERRVAAHDSGKGARYTAGRRPVRLVYAEGGHDRSSALRREIQLKKWPRSRKQRLIAESGPALPL